MLFNWSSFVFIEAKQFIWLKCQNIERKRRQRERDQECERATSLFSLSISKEFLEPERDRERGDYSKISTSTTPLRTESRWLFWMSMVLYRLI